MKKSYLFLVFIFSFIFSISAQDKSEEPAKNDNERKNLFLGAAVKGEVFINHLAVNDASVWKKPTLGVHVFMGKWFNRLLAGRIVVETGILKPHFANEKLIEKENYALGRLDVMLDVTNLFRSYSPDRFYSLIPYAGIGGAQAFNAKNRPDNLKKCSSFLFGGGLINTFRLSDNFSVCLNLGLDLVDAKFDGCKSEKPLNGIASASVGVVYSW